MNHKLKKNTIQLFRDRVTKQTSKNVIIPPTEEVEIKIFEFIAPATKKIQLLSFSISQTIRYTVKYTLKKNNLNLWINRSARSRNAFNFMTNPKTVILEPSEKIELFALVTPALIINLPIFVNLSYFEIEV